MAKKLEGGRQTPPLPAFIGLKNLNWNRIYFLLSYLCGKSKLEKLRENKVLLVYNVAEFRPFPLLCSLQLNICDLTCKWYFVLKLNLHKQFIFIFA